MYARWVRRHTHRWSCPRNQDEERDHCPPKSLLPLYNPAPLSPSWPPGPRQHWSVTVTVGGFCQAPFVQRNDTVIHLSCQGVAVRRVVS